MAQVHFTRLHRRAQVQYPLVCSLCTGVGQWLGFLSLGERGQGEKLLVPMRDRVVREEEVYGPHEHAVGKILLNKKCNEVVRVRRSCEQKQHLFCLNVLTL